MYSWIINLRSSVHKESACNAGDPRLIPGLGRSPRRRKWQPTPVFLPGESHGQRNLSGYGPWGLKESDMTVTKPPPNPQQGRQEKIMEERQSFLFRTNKLDSYT